MGPGVPAGHRRGEAAFVRGQQAADDHRPAGRPPVAHRGSPRHDTQLAPAVHQQAGAEGDVRRVQEGAEEDEDHREVGRAEAHRGRHHTHAGEEAAEKQVFFIIEVFYPLD